MNRSLPMAALAAALTGSAGAQAWLDDFNDGSAVDGTPVLWTASPAFASAFDVSDGDLVIEMPPGASPAISSARVPINFASGASVRARLIAFDGPGRFAVALADQLTGIKGYVASFSTCGGGRLELFRGDVPGAIVFLRGGQVAMPYGPLEEHYLQLDVFDGVVSARVWRPGEPFPEAQLSAPDTTYAGGVASIAIQDFGSGNCVPSGDFADVNAVVRFAQASSSPLTHSGIGDLDADGRVGHHDLAMLLAAWGDGARDPADLNDDGAVDEQDLATLLSEWG